MAAAIEISGAQSTKCVAFHFPGLPPSKGAREESRQARTTRHIPDTTPTPGRKGVLPGRKSQSRPNPKAISRPSFRSRPDRNSILSENSSLSASQYSSAVGQTRTIFPRVQFVVGQPVLPRSTTAGVRVTTVTVTKY